MAALVSTDFFNPAACSFAIAYDAQGYKKCKKMRRKVPILIHAK